MGSSDPTLMNLNFEPLADTFGVAVYPGPGERVQDMNAGRIEELYRSTGAVLFRGFNPAKDEFIDFSNQFFTPSEHPLRRPSTDHEGFKKELVYDVDNNRSRSPRYLHAELSYTPMMPAMCWFYCERAPESGGETTLGDGTEVLSRLSTDTRALFLAKRISYTWTLAEHEWKSMFKLSDPARIKPLLARFGGVEGIFKDDGALELTYSTCAVRPTRYGGADAFINALADYQREKEETPDGNTIGWVRFEDGSPISDSVFAEVTGACAQAEYSVRWSAGDFVMVDNTRIMHGRRTWPAGDNRVVYARFGASKV